MFEIILTHRAIKDLKTLDPETQRRIGKKLKNYSTDPLAHARKLTNPKIGTYRFRIGEYRIVFDLGSDKIVVLRIGHRKGIYK